MKNSRYFLLMIFCTLGVSLLFFIILNLGKRDELDFVCKYHKEFFQAKIIGSVTEHYIDSVDHARKTLVIKDQNGYTHKVWFINYDNWSDFERISVGDTVTKDFGSFKISINDNFTFTLRHDCAYADVID